MMSLLALCEVEPYMRGEIEQPNKDVDPVGHVNWKKNGTNVLVILATAVYNIY